MAGAPPGRPFLYVVVRVVPRVERGERFNVGVVLLCSPLAFLGARVALDERRLAALAPDARPESLRPHLDSIAAIADGDPAGGPIARLNPTQRFHWLAAPASTIIQASAIHTGICHDPAATLDHLFAELVERVRDC